MGRVAGAARRRSVRQSVLRRVEDFPHAIIFPVHFERRWQQDLEFRSGHTRERNPAGANYVCGLASSTPQALAADAPHEFVGDAGP